MLAVGWFAVDEFQSTLPRRERPQIADALKSIRDFNPRSREGSDLSTDGGAARGMNFNPRSREGSDRFGMYNKHTKIHFNPRSREGSDPDRCAGAAECRHFNPRSREGSDSKNHQDYSQ